MRNRRTGFFIAVLLILFTLPAFSQEAEGEDIESLLGFGLALGIGSDTFNEPDPVAYQTLNFKPDLSFGKFGVGLDVTIHFRFMNDPDNPDNNFNFRTADWIPEKDENGKITLNAVMDRYLPLIQYVRWGLKGEPLYIKLGSIEDGTLGNGFIMGNYSNTHFLPENRIFGMGMDLDGNLFNFPYVGIETFVGNLAWFDVFGFRLFARPLAWMEMPIIKDLQIGWTFAMDRMPYLHVDPAPETAALPVNMNGIDFRQPILNNPVLNLSAFGDVVFQPSLSVEKNAVGGMVGFGGRLFGLMTYGFQVRMLGDNFVPVYFDANYDLFRQDKYQILSTTEVIDGYIGAFGSMGFALLEDMILFNAAVDWSLSESEGEMAYPHLRAVFTLSEGLIPGVFLDASYDKRYIASWGDLISPENAVIGASINYKTGPAVITLAYDLKYNANAAEDEEQWETKAKLNVSLDLF